MSAPLLDQIAVGIRTDGRAPAERAKTALVPVADEIMQAQADLQTGLGLLRVALGHHQDHNLGAAERRLQGSLARLHALLDGLGRPMYDPAEYPKDYRPA